MKNILKKEITNNPKEKKKNKSKTKPYIYTINEKKKKLHNKLLFMTNKRHKKETGCTHMSAEAILQGFAVFQK